MKSPRTTGVNWDCGGHPWQTRRGRHPRNGHDWWRKLPLEWVRDLPWEGFKQGSDELLLRSFAALGGNDLSELSDC